MSLWKKNNGDLDKIAGGSNAEQIIEKAEYHQPGETLSFNRYTCLGIFTGAKTLYFSIVFPKRLERVKNRMTISASGITIAVNNKELCRDFSSSNFNFATDPNINGNNYFTHIQFNSDLNTDMINNRLAWVEFNDLSFSF